MSNTPEVDRTIAINKSEAAANQKAGAKATARWEAGARVMARDETAGRIYQGELDRAGSVVEKQQQNRIEKKPSLDQALAKADASKVRTKGQGRGSEIGL